MVVGSTFFKTRSIAKAAIEGGKVHHNNERVKVSKEIRVGMELVVQQGFDKKQLLLKRSPIPEDRPLLHNNFMKKQK